MRPPLALIVIAAVCLQTTAVASISILLSVDTANDETGVADVSIVTGSWLVLADTTGDGFGALAAGALSVGSLIGSDDLIVGRGDFTTFGTPGVVSAALTGLAFGSGWDEGDALAFVWFPNEGTAPASVADGDEYGLYTSATGQDGSDPWITPADGTLNHSLKLLTSDGTGFFGVGTVDPAEAVADLAVGGLPPDGDFDNDGMPNGWEEANGLNPQSGTDAAQDADGDGLNNLDEYRSGTDPNDPNSRLRMISVSDVSGNGTNYELTWFSVSNPEVMYEISWSTDLESWTSFETGIPAAGPTTVRQAAIVAQPPVFFRVGASR